MMSVILGRLRAVEAESIILGGNLRIHLPPPLSVAAFPIGCSLTLVVHQLSDRRLVAESISHNTEDEGGLPF
jgi:hypothetical protein